jgi:hypothetical protein
MRDLELYLPELKWTRNNKRRSGYNIEPEAIAIEAIERAIKAEDRVDTLQIVAKENYRMYENTLAENARLRKVADAARAMVNHCDSDTWFISGVRTTEEDLRAALSELDEEVSDE